MLNRRQLLKGLFGGIVAVPLLPLLDLTSPTFIAPLSHKFDYTDLYISPEALEDMRNWSIDHIDKVTRKEIYSCSIDDSFSVGLVRFR